MKLSRQDKEDLSSITEEEARDSLHKAETLLSQINAVRHKLTGQETM